ncbi:MAG: TonB-dependent siderophore receptor [Leptolyngbyaceae cyanobacterium]
MVKQLWGASLPTLAVLILLGTSTVAVAETELLSETVGDAATLTPIAQANPVEITDIQLEATDTGFTLQIETNGALTTPTTSTTGNATVADIPNAVLQLEGEEFVVSAPAAGIALVRVSALPNEQVRIAITGTEAPPAIDISIITTGLVVNATPGDPLAATTDEDALQVVVTGEEDDYFVPEASSATRTDTPILDTPASIQVIPRQVIEDQQVVRLDEALSNVSGVNFAGTFVGTSLNFNVRGFDAPTLRDGVQEFGGFTGASPAITNIERVEVLKGPASILYGQVNPGGIINLVTEQPLSEPTYDIGIQVGSRGFWQPQIDFSGPLTEDGRLLYRLNASYLHDDGFTDFEVDTEQVFVAPVLAWQISDRTNLTLSAEYLDEQQPFDAGLVASGTGVVDVPYNRIIVEPDNFTESEVLRLGYRLEHEFSDTWQIRNAFEYSRRELFDVGWLPFAFDETTGLLTRFPATQSLDTENFSLQTNVVGAFTTGSINHTLLAGIDWNRSNDREITTFAFVPSFLDIFNPVYGLAPIDQDSLPPFSNTDIQINRLGVYVQDQIEISDSLFLLAGLRYDTVDQDTTDNLANSTTSQNNDAWTPRLGVVYQPVEFLSLFASYAQSFTPNSGTTSSGAPLEPELGEGFEVGIKAELLEGDLLITLGYFDVTRQNVATTDPNNVNFQVTTGEQRSQGVELDIVGEILPGWNVLASYAYTDARVTADNDTPVGNRLFNVPEHSASLWTTYEIQSGELEGLGFGVGLNFVGERQGNLANDFQVNSYVTTDAAVFYSDDNWRFGLNAKNLFDVSHIAATNNTRTSGVEPGAPFTLIGSFSVQF